MSKFRKKPIVIEAVQWRGFNYDEICEYMGEDKWPSCRVDNTLEIVTLEGIMLASIGDWIIKGIRGEFYPCKPDVFKATYEAVT